MKKILLVITMLIGALVLAPINTYALDSDQAQTGTQSQTQNQGKDCVKTAIIGGGEVCDDGNGSSIIEVLKLVVNIMSVGVGILGVVGITVVGIQYLTAGGSEEKTRVAKKRMLEIVIGLAAYAVSYWILQWLLRGFSGI
jgi:hypothetical protein